MSTYGIDLKTTDKGQHIPTKEHKTQAILTSQNWKYDEEISCLVNTFIAAPDTTLSTAATLCVPKHSHHTHKHSYSLARQPVGQPFLEPQNSQLSLSDSWLAPCSCWLFSSLYGSCPFPEPLVPWPASRRALLRWRTLVTDTATGTNKTPKGFLQHRQLAGAATLLPPPQWVSLWRPHSSL